MIDFDLSHQPFATIGPLINVIRIAMERVLDVQIEVRAIVKHDLIL